MMTAKAERFRDEEREQRARLGAMLRVQLISGRVLLVLHILIFFLAVGLTIQHMFQGDLSTFLWVTIAVFNFHGGRKLLIEYEDTVGEIRMLECVADVMENLYNIDQ